MEFLLESWLVFHQFSDQSGPGGLGPVRAGKRIIHTESITVSLRLGMRSCEYNVNVSISII